MLEEKLTKMETEMVVYADMGKLQTDMETKKNKLQWEKVALGKQVENTKKVVRSRPIARPFHVKSCRLMSSCPIIMSYRHVLSSCRIFMS